jgi:hypothetical protein
MVVTKKQHKIGSATEESVLPPKTNDKNCIDTMNFISGSPSPPLRIPSPPTCRAEKGHASALQTFSLWRWGGNGLAVRQNPHSPSLTNPRERSSLPSLPNAIDIRFLPGGRLHRQQAMENEGAIGLTHRSCFRVAAAPTLATRGATIRRITVFEGKKAGEKGGRQVARGALVVGTRNTDHYQCTWHCQ